MQHVVCYDIADDRRRDHLASLLLNYGKRVQESVFVANLDGELSRRMSAEVEKALDADHDRVHIFHLCGACVESTVVFEPISAPGVCKLLTTHCRECKKGSVSSTALVRIGRQSRRKSRT